MKDRNQSTLFPVVDRLAIDLGFRTKITLNHNITNIPQEERVTVCD